MGVYDQAARDLAGSRAIVAAVEHREFSGTVVALRYWENVPEDRVRPYLAYLDTLRSVANPEGLPPGTYRILRNTYANEQGERQLRQYLAKDLVVSAPYSEAETHWRVANVSAYHSGSSRLVLELRDVDPEYARELAQELPVSPETLTNAVYTMTDGLVEGTWYNRSAVAEYDEAGVGVVRWFLSLHNNDDFWVSYYPSSSVSAIAFYKIGAVDTSKEDFLDNYYFAPDLHWYYSADGAAYTRLDGEDASGSLPADAANLRTAVEGRQVRVGPSYSDERGDWFLSADIQFETGASYPEDPEDGDFIVQYGEPEEKVRFVRHYVGVDLPDNADLVGSYEDIPASSAESPDEFGVHGVLEGRRLVKTRVENARVADGKFHYDLYEIETTAPIQENDGWFLVGKAFSVEASDNKLAQYRVQQKVPEGIDEVHVYTDAKYRTITTTRSRKFFMRQPTNDDMVAASAEMGPATATPLYEVVYEAGGGRGGMFYIEMVETEREAWTPWGTALGAYSLTNVKHYSVDTGWAT